MSDIIRMGFWFLAASAGFYLAWNLVLAGLLGLPAIGGATALLMGTASMIVAVWDGWI